MLFPKRIHLVEPDLAEFGGHFYTQDTNVVQECNRRGIPVNVYCRQGSIVEIPGAQMFRIFRFGVWIEPPQIESRDFAPFEIFFLVNRAFYLDLQAIDTSEFGSDELVFFPGVTQNQMDAISEWYSGLPKARRPRLAVTLRYLNARMHFNEVRGFTSGIEFLYRHALSRLKERCPGVAFVCDTETLSQEYQKMSGIPVTVLPVPQGESCHLSPETGTATKRNLNILYIGNLSPLRGSDYIPEIARSVLLTFPNVEFTIQIHGDPNSDYAKRVMTLPEELSSRVRFLTGALPPEEYARTMGSADIVLLPYAPSFYRWASSGVFAEAASAGKVLVVSPDTNMSKWALQYGIGAVVAEDFTPVSFSKALGEAVQSYLFLKSKSLAACKAFIEEHSAKSFLDKLLFAVSTSVTG